MEEKNKNNNRKLILTITGVLLLVALVIGITYAAWTYTFNGTKVSSLSTADIKLELLESDDNVINITNALPMDDASGKAQTTYFDFVVTSKTTRDIDIDYIVTMEKLSVDSGYTSLNDNQIKVYLTDRSDNPIWTAYVDNIRNVYTNCQLITAAHSHDSSHNIVQDKYRLRVWIDQNVDASNWNSSTKLQYKFRLNVSGGEHVEENAVYSLSTSNVSLGDTLSSITGATEDYTTLNKTFFLKHVIGNNDTVVRNDMCFIKNNTLYCLKGVEDTSESYDNSNPSPYYQENYNTLLDAWGTEAFSENPTFCELNTPATPIYSTVCRDDFAYVSTGYHGYTIGLPRNSAGGECRLLQNGSSICPVEVTEEEDNPDDPVIPWQTA